MRERTDDAAPMAVSSIDRREALRRAAVLLGGALSAPAIAGVLAGCDAAPDAERRLPRALDTHQFDLTSVMSERIIPTTDTPGARDAGVPQFIDTMLAEYYTADDRARFISGLASVDRRARQAHGVAFLRCTASQQSDLLTVLDRETFAAPPDAADAGFWRLMKELTVVGYYTSEVGATRELRYAKDPGRFDGCVPLADVGRAWAV